MFRAILTAACLLAPLIVHAAELPSDVAAEVAKFKDSDPKVRQKGLTALGAMKAKAKPAVPQILEMLKDNTTWVVTRAMMILPDIGVDESCAAPVAPFLAREPDIRSPAVDIFVALKEKGVPVLIDSLKDELRAEGACEALQKIGPAAKAAAPQLADTAKNHKSRPVREAAAKALKSVNK